MRFCCFYFLVTFVKTCLQSNCPWCALGWSLLLRQCTASLQYHSTWNTCVSARYCFKFTGNLSPMKSQQQQVTKTRERSPLPATFAHGLHSNRETEYLTTDKQLTHLFFSRRLRLRRTAKAASRRLDTRAHMYDQGTWRVTTQQTHWPSGANVIVALRHLLLLPASVAVIHGSLRP